jgi:hypothetical protein
MTEMLGAKVQLNSRVVEVEVEVGIERSYALTVTSTEDGDRKVRNTMRSLRLGMRYGMCKLWVRERHRKSRPRP